MAGCGEHAPTSPSESFLRHLILPSTAGGGFAYVTNGSSHNVSVIDIGTNTVTATVGVGCCPGAVAITPDGTRAYVTNFDSPDGVSVIDIGTNTVAATVGNIGVRPIAVAITPDGTRAYVTNLDSRNVSVIDIRTNTVAATVGVGLEPRGIAITPTQTTPEGEIQDLIQVISGSGLPHGIERSLVAKLEAALNALERGHVESACAILSAFINHVNAQAGKKLSLAQADQYRRAATALQGTLGCS